MGAKDDFKKIDIAELIIVEGKDDISALKKAVNADIIITNGLGLTKEHLAEISQIAQSRSVIVFTDPDYPGGKIRNILKKHLPDCKHAYINKADAVNPKTGKYGVEYASPEAIVTALKNAKATIAQGEIKYTLNDLVKWRLAGANSGKRRLALCEHLHIGQANAKGLINKLNAYQIPPEEIEQFIKSCQEEEL